MNNLKLPVRTWTTFFYGLCTEDKLTDMIKEAENDGCEFVQAMAGMIPAPQSAVALPNARQAPIPVIRILVRMRDEDYAVLVEKKKANPPKNLIVN